MFRTNLLTGIKKRGAFHKVAQRCPGQQHLLPGEAGRRPPLVVVFQAAQLVVFGGEAQFLAVNGVKIPAQRQLSFGAALVQRPKVVWVQDVEGIKQLGIGGGVVALLAEPADMLQMDAFPQPDGAGAHLLHRLPRRFPEPDRYGAGYIAAESVHISGPKA